jgi:hypothetical protein
MMVLIEEHQFNSEQLPTGYIINCKLDNDEVIVYGVFNTIDEAIKFGMRLINATVKPIYPPTLH